MTASQMIDITRMRSIYVHRETNPEIDQILQVADNNEKELATIGQDMMDGNEEAVKQYMKEGRIKMVFGNPIPETNAVYCLFVPPYYMVTDLNKKYE